MSGSREYLPLPKGFATSTIHDFQDPEQWDSMALVPPLVSSATFKQNGPNDYKKYFYGRCSNPNREILEKSLAKLENGQHGLCFSSGMGALAAVANLLKSGDHIICGENIYHGTVCLLDQMSERYGLELTYVGQKNIEEAIKPNTKLIWMESLTNPTMQVTDIKAVADLAHKHNILFGIDNTFVTPYFLRPLDFGADIVMHSVSKYINGHTDVVMGVLVTNDETLYNRLRYLQISLGIVPAPFDCYQVTRSIKTLTLRMQQHMKNALVVAKFLENHPKVDKVLHPGLPSHPQHDLYKKQASGCSGMFSFYLKGGAQETRAFLKAIRVFGMATSLGGVESLAGAPYLMTHGALPEDVKKRLNIKENMIRMSVGLEDPEDLLSDLTQALAKI